MVSRLVYRKGVDLLAQIIADVCLKNQKVDLKKNISQILKIIIKIYLIHRYNLLLVVMVLNENY